MAFLSHDVVSKRAATMPANTIAVAKLVTKGTGTGLQGRRPDAVTPERLCVTRRRAIMSVTVRFARIEGTAGADMDSNIIWDDIAAAVGTAISRIISGAMTEKRNR